MSFRPRTAANVAVVALVGLLGLTGCQSQPGHRRVVLDLIESIDTLPADEEACMKDVLGSYTNQQLDDIAEDNEALDFTAEDYVATGSELYQQFVEDLRGCTEGAAATDTTETRDTTESTDGESTNTTEASDTTDDVDTTEASDTTEAVDTTEAAETTEG